MSNAGESPKPPMGPHLELVAPRSTRDDAANRRDLLYVMIALRNGFLDGPELLDALREWAIDGAETIEAALCKRDRLSASRRALVEAILAETASDQAQGIAERSAASFERDTIGLATFAERSASSRQARTESASRNPIGASTDPAADMDDPDATRIGSLLQDATLFYSRYQKLRPLAKGGIGIVYVARDDELSREVALKELQDRFADDPTTRGRFMREAEITGGLEHPGVVPVHGLGRQPDGRPYYAMRLIKGESLRDAIDRYHQSGAAGDSAAGTLVLRRLLARFIAVCETIAYAHSRRIVHRDLKPSNIVLGHYGETLVVDWGLAKPYDGSETRADSAFEPRPKPPARSLDVGSFDEDPLTPGSSSTPTETLPGSAMGTPGYMSPEQALGRLDRLGPRSDIYSLGATLYCLLTGRPAFEGDDLGELVRRVERGDFAPPGRLNPKIDGDLEAVCLKAMALRPEDRYATARALAEDLEHWLADEPVSSRRESGFEKAARWARRHRTWARALTAALICIAFASMFAAFAVNRARDLEKKERRIALEQKREAERLTAALTIDRSLTYCERGDIGRGMLWLTRSLDLARESQPLQRVARTNLIAWKRVLNPLREILPHDGWVQSVAFSPDASILVVGGGPEGERGQARFWNPKTGKPIGEPLRHGALVLSVAFHPKGRVVATAGSDGLVRFWEAPTGKPIAKPFAQEGEAIRVAFNGDGSRVLTAGSRGIVRIQNFADGKDVVPPMVHPAGIAVAALSADDRWVAAATTDNLVRLWDAETGRPVGEPIAQPQGIYSLAFDPEGTIVAAAGRERIVRFWNLADRTVARAPLVGHNGPIYALAFSPDGARIVSGADDNTARVWDAATGEPIGVPFEHRGSVLCLTFSRDGETLATGSRDETARVWSPPSPPSQPLAVHSGRVIALDAESEGKYLLIGGDDGQARLIRSSTGAAVGASWRQEGAIASLRFSPDGRSALALGGDGNLLLRAVPSGELLGEPIRHRSKILRAIFRPDGRAIAAACSDGFVRFWDLSTRRPIGFPLEHPAPVLALAYGPDGKILLTGCEDNLARLWNPATGKTFGPTMRHQGPIYAAAFNADGRLIATAGDDNTARVWNVADGSPVGLPLEHFGSIMTLAFHPDVETRMLATGSRDKTVRLWDVDVGKPIGPPWRGAGSLFALAFSADGRKLFGGCADRSVRVRNLPYRLDGRPEALALWAQTLTGMQLDADGSVRVLSSAEWHERRGRARQAEIDAR